MIARSDIGRARLLRFWVAVLALAALGAVSAAFAASDRVSAFARYRGYSHAVFDGWLRRSAYVPVRDRTRLAVDVYLPTHDGSLTARKLPVLWTLSRYHRADIEDGRLITPLDQAARLQKFVRQGYALAFVDARGSGASFGTSRLPFAAEEAEDSYDITEWLASRPFCNGNVGMMGRSYAGIAQYLAAGRAPPHLKAIAPEMAMFDLYEFVYPGGIFRSGYAQIWSDTVQRLDASAPAAPVDADASGETLREAMQEHQRNVNPFALFQNGTYRNAAPRDVYRVASPHLHGVDISRAHIPIYHIGGWYDMFSKDTLLWYANLSNPQKLLIGPWGHGDSTDFDLFTEELRWFDYWLKGIDNGVMREAPVHYFTVGADRGEEWIAADSWPPKNAQPYTLYLQPPDHDGVSLTTALTPTRESLRYAMDARDTSGRFNRAVAGFRGPFTDGESHQTHPARLTFVSPPLVQDLQVTGHARVALWIETRSSDVDVIAYLREVDASGAAHYVTEGMLRASHRGLSTPDYADYALPYHRGFAEDQRAPESGPMRLDFDLHPISQLLHAGQRIQLELTAADRGNLSTIAISSQDVLAIHVGESAASALTLPVVPTPKPAAAALPRKPLYAGLLAIALLTLIVLGTRWYAAQPQGGS